VGRKRAISWRWRIIAALGLFALAGGVWLWWDQQHWAPSRGEYDVQGAVIGARDGPVDFRALRAVGADFAYLEASSGAERRDAAFARNFEAALTAGIALGAIHRYDPCVPADRQAANFVTIVPRDETMLPPVIALEGTADDCESRVSEGAVESELTTFLNQVEGHVGKPAILKLSPEFEARYGISARTERELWLARSRFEPDYAGRPWFLWTANSARITGASDAPLRWVVARR
jgi:lysozyme